MRKPSRHVSAEDRFWLQVNRSDEDVCWLWTGSKGAGENVHQRIGVNGKYVYVHRYAYELLVGPIPEGKKVLHECDNPRCVNPTHLFIGTQKDNILDMETKKRSIHPKGEEHGRAKLTKRQVTQLRKRRMAGEKGSALAKVFGISEGHVSNLTRNDMFWK